MISGVTNEIISELVNLKCENPLVIFAIFYHWIKDLYALRLKAQFEKFKKLRSCEEKEEKVQDFFLKDKER